MTRFGTAGSTPTLSAQEMFRPGLSRRAALGAGLSAAFWIGGGARAEPGIVELKAGPAATAPIPGVAALGFNGATPGPLIRLKPGEALKARLLNALDQPTTLSWPGLRPPNSAAGIGGLTQASISPGGGQDIGFVPPDSGFNLYRPDAGADTAHQIAGGLCGPIVVEETAPPPVDREIVAILSDWRAGGAPAADAPLAGPLVTANAAAIPLKMEAPPGARVRLRLANATCGRIMVVGVVGAPPLIMAIDGQPCDPFPPLRDMFPFGPGARFELMIDLPRAPGETQLVLKGGDMGALAGETDRALIVLTVAGAPLDPRPAFAGLPLNPRLPAEIDLQRALRPDLTISGGFGAYTINGISGANWPAKPAFTIARGAPATLGLVNKTAVVQAIRLHGHCMRLLHPLDDGWEPYWRDVALIGPGKTLHAAFVADNPGKWPVDSVIPQHRAAGVACWFEVV